MRTSTRMPVIGPLILLSLATFLLRLVDLDAGICREFFGGEGQWPMLHAQPFRFFYEYGPLPGYVIGLAGILIWLVGLVLDHDVARRGFFCMMLVLLGPGLIVNVVLKPHVQRPRPCQTVEFGGYASFQPVLEAPDQELRGQAEVLTKANLNHNLICKSFPSGHASMGFVTLAVPFLLRRRRKLFAVTLGVAVSWGLLIGISRVVQGRHYPSDVLWSAAIVYLLAVALYYVSGLHRVSRLTQSIEQMSPSLEGATRRELLGQVEIFARPERRKPHKQRSTKIAA